MGYHTRKGSGRPRSELPDTSPKRRGNALLKQWIGTYKIPLRIGSNLVRSVPPISDKGVPVVRSLDIGGLKAAGMWSGKGKDAVLNVYYTVKDGLLITTTYSVSGRLLRVQGPNKRMYRV